MFVFTQKLLNRDALQRILHFWPFEWRESDDSRLWRHKLYLVTSQIQRGRLYDSATWPPSLEQPSSAHHQRGQLFCERRCLFVIFLLLLLFLSLFLLLLLLLLLLLSLLLLLLLQFHHLCRPQRHCSCAARPGVPTSGHTQDSFGIVAPPPEVHRKWRQVVGGLPSERDTALLPSHFGGVHWCLFWFNKRRASPAMPPTDDCIS